MTEAEAAAVGTTKPQYAPCAWGRKRGERILVDHFKGAMYVTMVLSNGSRGAIDLNLDNAGTFVSLALDALHRFDSATAEGVIRKFQQSKPVPAEVPSA